MSNITLANFIFDVIFPPNGGLTAFFFSKSVFYTYRICCCNDCQTTRLALGRCDRSIFQVLTLKGWKILWKTSDRFVITISLGCWHTNRNVRSSRIRFDSPRHCKSWPTYFTPSHCAAFFLYLVSVNAIPSRRGGPSGAFLTPYTIKLGSTRLKSIWPEC